jgi:hypothetical protein
MNYALKEALKQTPFVDIGDFNALMFNVIELTNGRFSLILEYFYLTDESSPEDDEGLSENEYGIVLRTGIEEDNLVDIEVKIKALLNTGLFDHLVFIEEASCMTIDADTKYKFDWGDYMTSSPMFVN